MQCLEFDKEVEKIVDAIKDGSWGSDAAEDVGDNVSCLQLQELTASAAWVAEKFGRKRGIKAVKTAVEKQFFQKNWTKFQKGVDDETPEADNYSMVKWGEFARFWNLLLKEEDDGNRPFTDMTYKTAPMLMAYYQKWKEECNTVATLLPISEANKNLRRELRGSGRDTSVRCQATQEVKIHTQRPGSGTKRAGSQIVDPFNYLAQEEDDRTNPSWQEEGEPIRVQHVLGKLPPGVEAAALTEIPLLPVPPMRKPRNKMRCRMCGHTKDCPGYNEHHAGRGWSTQQMRRYSPADVCTTPAHERHHGFPVDANRRVSLVPRLL